MALPKVLKYDFRRDRRNDPDPHKLMLVHLMPEEVKGFDVQQGGESIDPETGLREYSRLGPLYDKPEIQEIAMQATYEAKKGKLSPIMSQLYETGKDAEQEFHKTEEDTFGSVKQLEELGERGDKVVVLLPKNVLIFYTILEGHDKIQYNTETHLPELGLWDEVKRFAGAAVGAVAGFCVGGPAGAAVGAGLGRAGAGMMTGQKPGHALMAGAKTGLLTYGAQKLPGMLNSAGNFLGGLTGAGAGTGAAGTAGAVGTAGTTAAGTAGTAGAAGAAKTAASQAGGWGQALSNLASPAALSTAGMATLNYLSDKKDFANAEKMRLKQKAEYEEEKRKAGFYDRWVPPSVAKITRNPEYEHRSSYEKEHGIFPESEFIYGKRGPEYGYAKGGRPKKHIPLSMAEIGHVSSLIKGKGKGQDDAIRTRVPEGSYIIDATSTANFGDGSSEAGAQVLKTFLNKVAKEKPIKHAAQGGPTKPVDVYLSNDEFTAAPHEVTALGDGNNDKGAYILKGIVKELRRHKNSNGDRLPPRAKSPEYYMRKSGRG